MATNPQADLLKQARDVQARAYAPYSNFKVGCVVVTTEGAVFSGCNVENASYGLTICAEVSAVASLVASLGAASIQQVLVIGSGAQVCMPCGRCRQFLIEHAATDAEITCLNVDATRSKTLLLADLLPHSFGRQDLEANRSTS